MKKAAPAPPLFCQEILELCAIFLLCASLQNLNRTSLTFTRITLIFVTSVTEFNMRGKKTGRQPAAR